MIFSIVIATKDRADFLERALASLETQIAAPPFETIVVDNGSSDRTPDVVADAARRGVLKIRGLHVPEPNRGAARNAGISAATGRFVLFVDDDVNLPEGFVAAHAAAHGGIFPVAVSGPILNVPGYDVRPSPSPANFSAAFFCTCNVSVDRSALIAAGGFDEAFNLYGWEDTELGLRLRRRDVRRAFAWDAYLWHIKPPKVETLDTLLAKTTERAVMAAKFLRKDSSLRTKLATGAYRFNLLRSALLAPRWSLPLYRRLATNERAPALWRAIARGQLLDGTYTSTLRAAVKAKAREPRPMPFREGVARARRRYRRRTRVRTARGRATRRRSRNRSGARHGESRDLRAPRVCGGTRTRAHSLAPSWLDAREP